MTNTLDGFGFGFAIAETLVRPEVKALSNAEFRRDQLDRSQCVQ
jgi:hypothetical protein